MGKKEMSGNKKNEIIKAAQKLFFENGYDATSIRSIMRESGGEVALFYYYFKGKDEVFDAVLDEFFQQYREEADRIFEKWKRNPFRMMTEFFTAMLRSADDFGQKYADKLHRTVLWTIRDYSLHIVEPYIKKMIDILVEYGAKPVSDTDIVSKFILNGVGSIILNGDCEETWKQFGEIRKCTNAVLGLDRETAAMMFPVEIQGLRIGDCIQFFNEHKDYTPWLDRDTFINEVSLRTAEHGVIAVEAGEMKLAGMVCFSRKTREITYLAVDESYLHGPVFQCLLVSAMAEMEEDAEVSICVGNPSIPESFLLYEKLCSLGFQEVKTEEKNGVLCKLLKGRGVLPTTWGR